MGKKPAAKKKGKVADARGFSTTSVASKKKDDDEEKEVAEIVSEEPAAPAAADDAAPAAAASSNVADGGVLDEEDEWERALAAAEEPTNDAAAAGNAEDKEAGALGIIGGEEWEELVQKRVEDELNRLDKKVISQDTTFLLERKGGATPAGVVVLNKSAEKSVEVVMEQLRDSDKGLVNMSFPRHWRYKGRLTYDRISGIWSTLESFLFELEHVRLAMEQTHGYDARAAVEFLLVNLPKERLPRQFGGEGAEAAMDAKEAAAASCAAASSDPISTNNGVSSEKGEEKGAEDSVVASPDDSVDGSKDRENETENNDASSETGEEKGAEVSVSASPEDSGDGSKDREDETDALSQASDCAENGKEADDASEAELAPEPSEESGAEPAAAPASSETDSPKFKPPTREVEPTINVKAKDKEQNKDFMKQYMMQYADVASDDDDDLLSEEERMEKDRRRDPTARYIKVHKQVEDLLAVLRKLKDKKKQPGQFKQNISGDMKKQKEASFSLSKVQREMETLASGKYGPIEKERVDAARSARAPPPPKPKAPPPPPKPEASPEAPAEDGDEAPLPSLFDGEDGGAAGSEDPKSGAGQQCRQYYDKSWTGKTPKVSCEEYVRKKIWGKGAPNPLLSYEKLEPIGVMHRARVNIHLPGEKAAARRFDPEEPCATQRDAENLAATFALFQLVAEADRDGMRRSIPPALRDRWQEWETEKVQLHRSVMRDNIRSKIEFLERLVRTKPPPHSGGGAGKEEGTAALEDEDGQDNGHDCMKNEGNRDDDDFKPTSSEAARKLRSDFRYRRERLVDDVAFIKIETDRAGLPVTQYRGELLRQIRGSGVVVVSGATGSGKTTQVPQMVLEDALENDDPGAPFPNIIVTEPRRISAVSVAKRVSQELGDPAQGPGSRNSLVGYQIRMEKKTCESTHLLFCTVGVLLKKLQNGIGNIQRVTHIFLDEVHERSADTDLMMLMLKQIRQIRPDLRIILMSATMEVEKIAKYFGGGTPAISIPGRMFPVQEYWLEDVVEMTEYRVTEDSDFCKRGMDWNNSRSQTFEVAGAKGKTQKLTGFFDDDDWEADDEAETCDPQNYSKGTARCLMLMEHTKINFELIELTCELIEGAPEFQEIPRHDGAILIFLPGLMEIQKTHERLERSPLFGDRSKCLVISLHSVLGGEEMAKAFDKPKHGVRKIVLSTNIAETGVTIPDCVYVIDAGKVKSQRYHEPSNTSSLKEHFVSRAEVTQRKGRAGRVRPGVCFRLFTKRRFELRLQEMPTPEILRCSLMELMLSVLTSGLQPNAFSATMDPPPEARIHQAAATLKATGAIEEAPRPKDAPAYGGGVNEDKWFVLTPLGQCLAKLPCDVRLGKMALYASLFGGIEAVWTVAATLSHRSPLSQPFSEAKRAQAKAAHCAELLQKDLPPSDHMAANQAFTKWEKSRKDAKASGGDIYCRKAWLSGPTLSAIKDVRKDLVDSVKNAGFSEKIPKDSIDIKDLQSTQMASAILLAGLFPNVARLDQPKNAGDKIPILSAGSEQMRIHPGSLCHNRVEHLHKTNYRWLTYHTKVKTSQVFLRDATFFTPAALMLFGGETGYVNLHPTERSASFGLGGERHWQSTYCAPRSVACLRQLRYAFDAVLRRKAAEPRKPLEAADHAVLAAYVAVIMSGEATEA